MCIIFCRGKRTADLPDQVRAQVLVNGGHCEGCAGDNSSCRDSSSSSGSISPIARASEIRESSALPRKVRLAALECLRQRLPDSRHQGTGCWWKLGAGVLRQRACAACEGVKAPFDGQHSEGDYSCLVTLAEHVTRCDTSPRTYQQLRRRRRQYHTH